MAFACRAAELEVLARGPAAGAAAIRELLALQASDWAFMVSRGIAVPYAHERFDGHRTALARALGPQGESAGLRNLARDADRAALLAP
jgi:1,4-alpha-glucan branching enzyme